MMRNFQKLKTLEDFAVLDPPVEVTASQPAACPLPEQKILRMLVRPKYGAFRIPPELDWLRPLILELADLDHQLTGISDSWCYVTVRHGPMFTRTDDEWHFDGASFRTSLIPERNYVWADHSPMQYLEGGVEFPPDFDPQKHNLFTFARSILRGAEVCTSQAKTWYLLSPFCLHRRDPTVPRGVPRTFLRVSFPDIEGRDEMNTPNPLLPTPAWGRNPVRDFRDALMDYPGRMITNS